MEAFGLGMQIGIVEPESKRGKEETKWGLGAKPGVVSNGVIYCGAGFSAGK